MARIRALNYRDLNFLYFACMVSIAVVYTAFRVGAVYFSVREESAVGIIQRIDAQRELATRIEDMAETARKEPSVNPRTVEAISRDYAELISRQHKIAEVAAGYSSYCFNRLCYGLTRADFFAMPPEQLAVGLNDATLPDVARDTLLRQLSGATARYQAALGDGAKVALEYVREKKMSNRTFDIATSVALMLLLGFQAVYIFRPAVRRLNASLATRADFLSRISHEIRNPMNSILGMADILKGTRLNFEQRQYVENLSASGNALLDMLNNLIDFSEIESGRMHIKSSPFDLFRTIDRCLNLIAIQAHHKNLSVYVSVDPRVSNRLVGDASRLDQVLINLLNNAVKFTANGHVKLDIRLVNEDDQREHLTFAVSDTGIGIRRTQIAEIFESFVQGDISIRRKYGGSGLGLSIAREIVRMMGGRIRVESEFGKGTRFFFTVPFMKRKARRNHGEMGKPLQQLAKMKFVFITASGGDGGFDEWRSSIGCETEALNSASELGAYLEAHDPSGITEILIDDSVGIIAMINCRNLAEQFDVSNKAVALIRSNFTKENMDLLRRNGYTRFLIKPLKAWELLNLPAPHVEEQPARANSPAGADGIVAKLREKRLKILLVDDSDDNLFLLKEVVGPLANTVHLAENGLQAIEKFRHSVYDVVLMDIQMPVMDGYTAIRKMRELEVGTGRSTPIFAVTAHGGLVDAQKCKEAGFTDRIVKPVLRSDIYKLLAKSFAVEVASPEGEQEDFLPPEYLARLLPTYYKTRFDDLAKLHVALDQVDFKNMKRVGHKIRGGSASYGFFKTSELSRELENAAANSDLPSCLKIVEQLENLIKVESESLERGQA